MLLGVCDVLYLAFAVMLVWLVASAGPMNQSSIMLLILLAAVQLFQMLYFLDTAIRAAYLDGTVLVERRLYGLRRIDVARAPGVRLTRPRFGAGVRFSAFDPPRRKVVKVGLRPSTYGGPAATHPLLALADAILAGPPRPEPMGREAWAVAQQLRQAVVYMYPVGQPAGRVQPPTA